MVSVRRVAPVLLLVMATSAFAQKTLPPPKDLHRVGDHWTPYNPPDPASYPAGSKTHEIMQGDTLWALAQRYYGNAYLWPQLWETNTWITDAHWIYPGDVLLLESDALAEQQAATEAASEAAISADERAAPVVGGSSTIFTGEGIVADPLGGLPIARIARENRPIALATESDLYCYGYIGHPDEPLPNWISSFEDIETKYVPRAVPEDPGSAAPGDLIYVTGGAETGLVAGETYLVVNPSEIIKHPKTGAVLGRHYAYEGQVRILCIEGNRSRAIVVSACREIHIGNRLKPVPQLPIPIARVPDLPAWCDPPSGRTSGVIVDSRDWDLGLVEGSLLQIDLGREDQLQPGDFLTVSRPSPRSDQPRQVLGQIGVLTTEAHTATAVVLTVRRELLIGDQVELR